MCNFSSTKYWWTSSFNGKIKPVVCFGNKTLGFSKGKNVIELADEAEGADAIRKV